MAQPAPEQNTWKDVAGRSEGHEGYKFGDVSRTAFRRATETLQQCSERLQDWSNRPRWENGYEFGDLFLKDLMQGRSSCEVEPPCEPDDDESAEHMEIAASMGEKRQESMRLFAQHLPRLQRRLQELESKQACGELDCLQASEIFRIKSSLETYRKCLKDLKQCCEVRLDGAFVRIAESCGDLPKIQKALEEALQLSKLCARCADDLCPPSLDAEQSER